MLANLVRRRASAPEQRFSMSDYVALKNQFAFDGHLYNFGTSELSAAAGLENPIVAACIDVRTFVFRQMRFQFQAWENGRPGRMFGTPALRLLERPWASATTGDLLARMELDASAYGNSYWVADPDVPGDLLRLEPKNVVIATSDAIGSGGRAYAKRLLGYYYVTDGGEANFWTPDEIAHYRPLPDKDHPYRGRTWLSSVLPDVGADKAITNYKAAFLRNNATPSMVITYDPSVSHEAFERFMEVINTKHSGAENAFKTLHLAGGADVKTIGMNFEQLALKATQGAGETRIASAAGVPAVILGISEGLQGSSLNSGNYGAARRRFSDVTMQSLWGSAADALAVLVPPPGGSRLKGVDADVAFLQEDVKDAADIRMADAQTIRTLVDGGFEPLTVVDAVNTGDFTKLVHTGLTSVQLTPPGADAPATP